MPNQDRTGPMDGQGRGRGRMGGQFTGKSGRSCTCPKCNYETNHIMGQPCNQRKCPKCGSLMMRG
ncbi:MAG: hypothetical protein U9P44_04040 [archaeon]|nr:hypothetical protein [archaeon]